MPKLLVYGCSKLITQKVSFHLEAPNSSQAGNTHNSKYESNQPRQWWFFCRQRMEDAKYHWTGTGMYVCMCSSVYFVLVFRVTGVYSLNRFHRLANILTDANRCSLKDKILWSNISGKLWKDSFPFSEDGDTRYHITESEMCCKEEICWPCLAQCFFSLSHVVGSGKHCFNSPKVTSTCPDLLLLSLPLSSSLQNVTSDLGQAPHRELHT